MNPINETQKTKKILLNAISIKEGGGLIVLMRILDEICPLQSMHWFVIVDERIYSKIPAQKNITLLSFPWSKRSPVHFLFWHECYLPILIRRLKVDLFFSHTNVLPVNKLSCRSLLLLHHAGYFSSVFSTLQAANRFRLNALTWMLRKYWVYYSIKRSDILTVQTVALAEEVKKKIKNANQKICVIPHGCGLAYGHVTKKQFPEKNIWRIGYITKYGVQKNFGILFDAIKQLNADNINCQLILTLDQHHSPVKRVQNLICQYQINDWVKNYGELEPDAINAIYQSLDIFVFPSLCESFGFTLVEAMYFGLPVIAADTPSNREILGVGGLYFSSYDSMELTTQIRHLLHKKEAYEQAVDYSLQRSQQFCWKKTAKQLLAVINEQIQ